MTQTDMMIIVYDNIRYSLELETKRNWEIDYDRA